MSVMAKEVIEMIDAYLSGAMTKSEASAWAIGVLHREVFGLHQLLLEDAVTALAGLHDDDERWDTDREDLAFFKQCLEGKRAYPVRVEVFSPNVEQR